MTEKEDKQKLAYSVGDIPEWIHFHKIHKHNTLFRKKDQLLHKLNQNLPNINATSFKYWLMEYDILPSPFGVLLPEATIFARKRAIFCFTGVTSTTLSSLLKIHQHLEFIVHSLLCGKLHISCIKIPNYKRIEQLLTERNQVTGSEQQTGENLTPLPHYFTNDWTFSLSLASGLSKTVIECKPVNQATHSSKYDCTRGLILTSTWNYIQKAYTYNNKMD